MPKEVRQVTHSCGCVRLYTLEDMPAPVKAGMVAQLEREPCRQSTCPRRVAGMRRLLARVADPSANGKGEG
jgi:hypothetical protein